MLQQSKTKLISYLSSNALFFLLLYPFVKTPKYIITTTITVKRTDSK